MRLSVLTLAALIAAAPALADDAIQLAVKNHKFAPSVIHVKANTPNLIVFTNQDPTAEEFDSSALKVEKVVPGNSSGNIRIRPLAPGRYPFMGEYNSATAQGVVVAE
jgi:plastocyanin domain-containing protein